MIFFILPELINCIPMQKEITYLWQEMAKNRNQAPFDVLVRPNAIPSKTAWRLKAKMTRNPLKAAYCEKKKKINVETVVTISHLVLIVFWAPKLTIHSRSCFWSVISVKLTLRTHVKYYTKHWVRFLSVCNIFHDIKPTV